MERHTQIEVANPEYLLRGPERGSIYIDAYAGISFHLMNRPAAEAFKDAVKASMDDLASIAPRASRGLRKKIERAPKPTHPARSLSRLQIDYPRETRAGVKIYIDDPTKIKANGPDYPVVLDFDSDAIVVWLRNLPVANHLLMLIDGILSDDLAESSV